MNDWHSQALELAQEGMSWRQIAATIDKPRSTVSDYLRKVFSQKVVEEKHSSEIYSVRKEVKDEDNSRVLLISDMHIPYHHPDLIPFLKHLKDKYNPTRIVSLGDECFPP